MEITYSFHGQFISISFRQDAALSDSRKSCRKVCCWRCVVDCATDGSQISRVVETDHRDDGPKPFATIQKPLF
ncbi:hypothetical protein CEXT_293541 [Caerostris extrusa]|uniref:Uncharacterized protein n=1 Tax=Caerostris extrusa TaxID=172846 RepID=A0AAV4QHV9_CAEEX|nr:hypothetical protein CEXT_293541 [Caerostris extrusa]